MFISKKNKSTLHSLRKEKNKESLLDYYLKTSLDQFVHVLTFESSKETDVSVHLNAVESIVEDIKEIIDCQCSHIVLNDIFNENAIISHIVLFDISHSSSFDLWEEQSFIENLFDSYKKRRVAA